MRASTSIKFALWSADEERVLSSLFTSRRPVGVRSADTWLPLCAVSLVAASLVHVAVMPDHFRESIWYGGFFLAIATTQIVVAVRVLRKPSRALVVAVVVTSVWIIVLWAWTRLVGVPVGPDNGATEPLGVLDAVASLAEFYTVGFGLLALRGGGNRAVIDPRHWPLATRAVSAVGIATVLFVCLVASRS